MIEKRIFGKALGMVYSVDFQFSSFWLFQKNFKFEFKKSVNKMASTFDAICDALEDEKSSSPTKTMKNKKINVGGVKFDTVTEEDKRIDFLRENAPTKKEEKEEEGENEILSATVLYDMWSKSSDIMSLAERYAMERKKRGLDPVHSHEKNRKKKIVPYPSRVAPSRKMPVVKKKTKPKAPRLATSSQHHNRRQKKGVSIRRKKSNKKHSTFGLPGRSAERSCFLGLVDGFGVTLREKSNSGTGGKSNEHHEDEQSISNLSNAHLHHRFLNNTRNPRQNPKQRKQHKRALRRDRWLARQRAEANILMQKKKKGMNLRKPRSGGRSSSDQSYDSQQDRHRKDGRSRSIERQLIAAVDKLRRDEEMKNVSAAAEFRPHRGSSLSDVLSDEFLGVETEQNYVEQDDDAAVLEAQTSEGHIADDEDDDERISASWARAHRSVSKD